MSTPTFHAAVFEQRADGSYNIKIRVYFNGKGRKLPTSLFAYPSDLKKDKSIKNEALLDKVRALTNQMRTACDDLTMYQMDNMDVDDLITHIRTRMEEENGFKLDFIAYGMKVAAEKPVSSGRNYKCAIHAMEDFIGTNTLDISLINVSFLRKFQAYLEKKHGDRARAVSLYISAIASIHKEARLEFNDEMENIVKVRNPFEFYKVPKQSASAHRNADIDTIRLMLEQRETLVGRQRLAVDAALISFGLMGMNTPDLFACSPEEDGVITYYRQKTRGRRSDRSEMRVRIEPQIRPIVDTYRMKRINQFNFVNRYSTFKEFGRAIDIGLASWCESAGVDKVTMYSMRHAWATIAYSLNIDKGTINDCLCHVDPSMRVTDIYINKDWSRLWNANAKVLDFLVLK